MQKLFKFIALLLLITIKIAIAQDNINLPIHYQAKLLPFENSDTLKAKSTWRAIKNRSLLLNAQVKATANSSDLLLIANNEYANILAILQDNAYFGPTVSITINGIEVHNISSTTNFPTQNNIIISINRGKLYHVGHLTIIGASPSTKTNLKTGDIANALDIKQLSLQAMKDLQNAGYADAKIVKQQIIADDVNAIIDFYLELKAGQKIYLRYLKIINQTTPPAISNTYIARLSGFRTNILATPKIIDKYHENLEQLDLFNNIIVTRSSSDKDGWADLTIIVSEKPKHNFNAGINYDNKNGFGAAISWFHRNITGHGDHLTIKSTVDSLYRKEKQPQQNHNKYNYDYSIQYDLAGIIRYNIHLALGVHGLKERTFYYNSQSLELKAGLYKILTSHSSGSIYLNKSSVKDDSAIFNKRVFNLIGIDSNFGADWRDDTLEPHKGYLWNLRINPLFESNHSHFLTRFEIEARTYLPLDINEKYILALRGKYGVITGTTLKNIPSTMQYFAGGGDTLRGFRYRSVGLPIYLDNNSKDSAVGGISMALLSAEMRFHLFGNLGAVAFIDNASLGANSLPKNKTLSGAGIGVRYKTMLGPIRLDVATPLKQARKYGKLQLYVGIGEAF